MNFLEISSLWAAYRFAIKIEQKFNQKNKRAFGFANQTLQNLDKGGPNSQNKGEIKDIQTHNNHSKPHMKLKKDIGKWCELHKSSWHNTDEC